MRPLFVILHRAVTGSSKQFPGRALTIGARAACEWMIARGLETETSWFVEIAIDVLDRPASSTYTTDADTRFHINVYPEEWGVFFCHGSRASWIRVTDLAFVHGRDDHRLLDEVRVLPEVGGLLRDLEHRYRLAFRRDQAMIHANVAGAETAIRSWLATI
jgi:hypothetical protein